MSTETEKAVVELLAANNISYNVTARGPMVRDKWECDGWDCRFAKEGRQENFEYYTGTGHRTYPHLNGRKPTVAIAGNPGTVHRAEYDARYLRAVAPPAASVLHSLILDSSAAGQSFDSWCADFGYDTDSRKAEDTYRECQRNADKLARVLGHVLIAELSKLLEDY